MDVDTDSDVSCELRYYCRAPDGSTVAAEGVEITAFGPLDPMICSVVDPTTEEIDDTPRAWSYRAVGADSWQPLFDGRRSPALRLGYLTGLGFGAFEFAADMDVCDGEVIGASLLPAVDRPSSVMVRVDWESAGSADSDLDLSVLRDPDECWTDRLHCAYHQPEDDLDWGVRGPGDEPAEYSGDVRVDGAEWIFAHGRAPGEAWEVGVNVYAVSEGSPVSASVEVVVGGSVVLSVQREFEEEAWWSVARIQDDHWQAVDTVLPPGPPECLIADRCRGGRGEPEICDGIDNDCDGVIDEDPDACYNEIRQRISCREIVVDGGPVQYLCG